MLTHSATRRSGTCSGLCKRFDKRDFEVGLLGPYDHPKGTLVSSEL